MQPGQVDVSSLQSLLGINFLRIFLPDVALFWQTAFEGLWRLHIPALVATISYVLIALAFSFILYEMLVVQSLAPLVNRGVRIAIAFAAITAYPWFVGGPPYSSTPPASTTPAWNLFHSIYVSIYGDGTASSSSFYSRWLINGGRGPMAHALADFHAGFQRGLATKAVLGTVSTLLDFVNRLPAQKVACTVPPTPVIAAYCTLKSQIDNAIKKLNEAMAQALHNFVLTIMILMGAHAMIIYATLAIFTATVFIYPIPAALAMFRGGERAFLTVVGLYLGSFLALAVSAVAFAAASATLYRTLGSIISQQAFKQDTVIQEELDKLEKRINSSKDAITRAKAMLTRLERTYDTWNRDYTGHVIPSVDENGIITDPGPRTWWGTTVFRPASLPGVPSDIVFWNGELKDDPDAEAMTFTDSYYTCTGTEAMPGTKLQETNFSACFTEMQATIQRLRSAIDAYDMHTAGFFERIVNRLTAFFLRLSLIMNITLGSAIVLAFILSSAMVTLVIRMAGVVQGFNLGSGVPLKP